MRRAAVNTLGLLLLAAGCASPAAHFDAAMDAVRADVAARLGEPPPRSQDPMASEMAHEIAPEVEPLLAGELTEDNAVRIALLNNRDVRASYERLGIAAADLVAAGLLKNPVFGGGAVFFLDGGTEVELGLSQPFLDLFFRPLRRRMAEHELAAATAAVTHDLVHLAFSVRREFARVRAAQQLVVMQQQSLVAATAGHELMRELYRVGNVTAPQRTAERVAEGRARLDLAAAERAAREAREPLNALLGLWGPHTEWQVAGALPESVLAGLDLERVESRAIERSLDLLENRAAIDRAAQLAGLTSWEGWLPDASVGIGGLRESGGEWALGPAAHIELPIFDRGQARVMRAESMLRGQLHRRVQIAVEVRSAARLLRDRLSMLEQQAQFLRREFVPARAALLHETLQNYNAMQIGVFDVFRQRQLYLAARREHLTTLRDAWLTRLDLEELLAGSIPNTSLQPFWPEGGADAQEGGNPGH